MRILDSNIVIYATKPDHAYLLEQLLSRPFSVSMITRLEVLGWHGINDEDQRDLEQFLKAGRILAIDACVVDRAIRLRQLRRMSLGDSLIAATTLEFDYELVTRNTSDFMDVPGLRMIDPFVTPP